MSFDTWAYSLISVVLVSAVSLIGIFTLSLKEDTLRGFVLLLVSFAAGALFGDAFLHLLPEAVEESGFGLAISLSVISGILFFFVVEKVLHWRHCHLPITKHHVHPVAIMNLFGDGVHNFLDGAIIAASYMTSVPVGIATTVAVLLHEIPQEIGDFGILLHAGFTRKKAIMFNFFIALTAVLGAAVTLVIGNYIEGVTSFLVPFAIGGFIYIAGSDLIPEMHKECKVSKSALQLLALILGVLVMAAFLLLE